jgi:hypothetical protein
MGFNSGLKGLRTIILYSVLKNSGKEILKKKDG